MPSKVLPGSETVLLIPVIEVNGVPKMVGDPADGLVDFATPTVDLLNWWIPVNTTGHARAGSGGNVSCALRDDLALGLTDSDTDSDRTICSVGASEALTFVNFESEFNVFRDAVPSSTSSVFVLATELIRAADVPYVIAHRIGRRSTDLTATTEEWDFYYAVTDNPVPVYDDGGNMLTTQAFVPKNLVNTGYELAA